MMTGDPHDGVSKLKNMALNLGITGKTNEQTLLLAIIDALDELAKAINDSPIAAEPFNEQSYDEAIYSRCPNCGESIHIDLSNLNYDEPIVCSNCHEVIGVISDSM